MLSEEEKEALKKIEENLYKSDQKLAEKLRNPGRVKAQAVVLGVLGVLLGLGVVMAGVATQVAVLGVVGFLIMLTASTIAFRAAKNLNTPNPTPKTETKNMYSKIEERWNKRQNEK
jgi:uncharacterized membrane protein YkgB